MTISRGQMPRQMYGLGSLVKSITKPFKKVAKGVKSFAKSDVGKLALTAGALYGLGGGTFFGKGLPGLARNVGGFSFGNIAPNVMNYLVGQPAVSPGIARATKGLLGSGGKFSTMSKILGIGIPSLLAAGQVPKMEEFGGKDKEELARYLRRYYSNLNQDATDEEIEEFVRANMARGGRIGYAEGNPDQKQMAMVEDMLKRGMDMSTIKSITGASDKMIQDRINFIKYGGAKVPVEKANGGRIGYAFGDSAEDNAIQASGIMDLPLNKNPAGVTELDLRETGGFIPPVGVKEKADDIPAMLSNNEFVFTADAVRGMGGGDVDKGAERMYAMMKTLENGGRV